VSTVGIITAGQPIFPSPDLKASLFHTTPQWVVRNLSPNGAQYGSLGQRPRKTDQMFCKPQRGGISQAFYGAPLGLRFFDTPGPGALPQALISRPFRAKKRFEVLLFWLRPSARRSSFAMRNRDAESWDGVV
jgi:hypothetical protein